MFYPRFITLAVVAFMASRVTAQCDDTETTKLLCYEDPDGTPQDVTVADVQYVASYLRSYGAQTQAGRQFTQTVANAPDCAEWTLFAHGSVLALGKHIDPTVNSSVLFSDIANTIDGGAGATSAQQAAAIIGCATNGGSLGVVYNASNPQYHTSTYLANDYSPAGVLIKIVNSGA
ncbi:hypothetical protein F5Y12DRAFT_623893 [Xylaria sp. FL1777]|nr:hypothetical protein F5Y12DRAFT_623893 [Xylaria sp. FL1777]